MSNDAYAWLIDMISPVEIERRCIVWWNADGRGYGRHFPTRAADGTPIVPRNVCNRAFMSQYPATVCDDCAVMIRDLEARLDLEARKVADAAASAHAQATSRTGTGRRGGWQ